MDQRFLIIILAYAILALYGYRTFANIFRVRLFRWLFILAALAGIGFFVYEMNVKQDGDPMGVHFGPAGGFFLSMALFSTLLALTSLIDDIFRVFAWTMNHVIGRDDPDAPYWPARRKFVSGLGLAVGAIPFGGMLYGMYEGKYRFQVVRHELFFDDLPEAFDGYRIVQVSDIHAGSLDDYAGVAEGIRLANAQDPDLLVFTGDMVNDRADELLEWSYLFSTLQARDGKYAVLGNHDYGDYVEWTSESAKDANLSDLLALQREMGFEPLLNEHRFIEREGQRIALVGVENWGDGRFVKKGDLDIATEGLDNEEFKVLMSHDPSHWEAKVLPHDLKFHLTLSGHTHGFQFGVELPGTLMWSPVQYRYRQWAGMYGDLGRHLNVNRGFGFIGYPGRVGIWPEISVITLRTATAPTRSDDSDSDPASASAGA